MKLKFLTLPYSEQQLFIEQAALKRNISPIVMEKDFWVSWLLGILFQSEFASHLVFKGGTSLSKVFGVIDRFSEDIDISLSPMFLNLSAPGESRNQANKWMERAEAACTLAVRENIQPIIEAAIKEVLGTGKTWLEFRTDPHSNSPVLLFHYPSLQPKGFEYLLRSVKIEFGSLTDQQPTGQHAITAWVSEVFPQAFPDWNCQVIGLEIERTFWEKATILHAEYYRPIEKPTPDRFSRHYADTASLTLHADGNLALKQDALRERVVSWKSHFFGSSWANYDKAIPGTFKVVPPAHREQALRRDYQAMRNMYLGQPKSFDEIMSILSNLESTINK